ncbi:MAG: MerR family transcriptional regulator [Calditrichae bacterium]|nr:MerR family transcriptional regulator [Calditrichota bacterium]MCB9057230.1 MerR family transcriptional regulator [Calditrichia bacterium]
MLNIENISYSIGQVSEMTGIAQSTLRYWETVIDVLTPRTTPGGSRRYNRHEIELIGTIKDLLYNQGYTIKGANQFLKSKFPFPNDDDRSISEEKETNDQQSFKNIKSSLSSLQLIEKLEKIKKILAE